MTQPLHALLFVPLALALTAAAQTGPAPAEAAASSVPPGPRVQRITHEDALTRIDELRVGGQTRSIDVQPKNGAPAYQVAPPQTGQSTEPGRGGQSSWRILRF
jgi:hypothetical protein